MPLETRHRFSRICHWKRLTLAGYRLRVYGYASGLFSSRKIERATYDSVAFRYLAAGSHPDHEWLA